jgi:lysozyme
VNSIKAVEMAREVAKAGKLLPRQVQAFQLIDTYLTESQRADIRRAWSTVPQADECPYLTLVPLPTWSGKLRNFELALHRSGGVKVDSVPCNSGAPGAQDFIPPERDYPGSMRPIPEGRYSIGPVEVADRSWGPGLGRVWIGLTPINPRCARGDFGIHLDSNRGTAPGSAGCVVLRNDKDLDRVVGWLRAYSRPDELRVLRSTEQRHQIPAAAIALIKEYEGCHLEAYPDPGTGGAPWTIGYGSTIDPGGRPVRPGQVITQEQAEEWLTAILERRIYPQLAGTIPGWDTLHVNQQAALISFAYNVGENFYGTSGFSTITKALANQDYKQVPKALELYRNPGTSVEAGLLRRRRAEGALWAKR